MIMSHVRGPVPYGFDNTSRVESEKNVRCIDGVKHLRLQTTKRRNGRHEDASSKVGLKKKIVAKS